VCSLVQWLRSMTFVCTLSSEDPLLAPVVSASDSRATLVYPIGYDDEDDSSYQLFVSFDRAPGGVVEYSFCITCTYSSGVVHDFWDSKVVANMISSSDRASIRALLLDATARLIENTNFPEVIMHSFAPGLPPKALAKYRRIAQLFRNQGYRVRETVRGGQCIWRFNREAAAARGRRARRRRGR